MNIEKTLRNYLKGNGKHVKYTTFYNYVVKKNDPRISEAIINVLFNLLNEEVESMDDTKCLNRTIELLNYLTILIVNCDDIDRKHIERRLNKLVAKCDRIEVEGKKKFKKPKHIRHEFERFGNEVDSVLAVLVGENNKQFEFVRYLVEISKDLSYLEYAITHSPNLINAKDKNNTHIFKRVIEKLVQAKQDEEENYEYYKNVISLFLSKEKLYFSQREKKKMQDDLYKYIYDLKSNKKQAKTNKEIIEYLKNLTETLKTIDDKRKDIDTLSNRYKINIYFDEEVIEAAKLSKEKKEGTITNRKVVEDYIISMDSENASEIDDALSCTRLENGNYLLGVHIASVLAYFPYDSEIVKEAIERNQSIYLRKGFENKEGKYQSAIPIFPFEFSADTGSLIEGDKKLTRSYYFEVTPTGEIVNEVFYKTIIQNNKKMTYNEVNKMLKNVLPEGPLGETIKNLKEVTDILSRKNSVSHIYEQIKENVDDTSDLRVKNTGAENIVYQSALLTGTRVAEFFARHNYPFIYRVHEVNEENALKLQAMVEELDKAYGGQKFENLYQLIAGIYPTGWYATEGRHDGLGKQHYCHVTSGLRRASDIVAEHCLEVCYDKEPTEEELEELREDVENKILIINSRQKPIEWFTKEYKKSRRR